MSNCSVNFFDDHKGGPPPVIALLAYSTGVPYFRLSLGGLNGLTIFISPERLAELHGEIGIALMEQEAATGTAEAANASA